MQCVCLGVCSELRPVCFPIVRECVSVSLYFVFSACIVCQVVRLYSVVEIVVMSGEVARCSVVCFVML